MKALVEKKISCCGTVCSECEYYPADCRGCREIKGRVFWLEYTQESICDIYDCCMNPKKYDHCGHCKELPCSRYEREDPTKNPEENTAGLRVQINNLKEYGKRQKQKSSSGSQDLQTVPGVGKRIAQYLNAIGIHCVDDLKGRDPEELYRMDCIQKGFTEDRCELYVFRCAVYYAEHEEHDPEKLKWWYWKDKE